MKTLWILALSLLAFASCTDDVDSDNSPNGEADSVTDSSSEDGDSQSDEDTSSSQSNTGDDPKDTGTGSAKDTGTGSGKDTGTGKDTGSGKDSDTGDALPATNGSCKAPNGTCSDYIGSGYDGAQMQASCEAAGDGFDWFDGHCPAAGRVGMCRIQPGTPYEAISAYYSPDWTNASAQKNCSDGGGTWM